MNEGGSVMRKPPPRPTNLRPKGAKITLPKPTLVIDSMEQKPYAFNPFRKWFAEIEFKKLRFGDYSIAGLEDRVAVERKSLQDLFNSCSPCSARESFVRSCDRLSKLDFAALVIEGSISRILQGSKVSGMHPNAVFGTIQALAVRWGIQPWFAPSRVVAEEITACLLHKAYQLASLEKRGLPRRFVEGDI
jgi:DNA excision repair protein ERCC-4